VAEKNILFLFWSDKVYNRKQKRTWNKKINWHVMKKQKKKIVFSVGIFGLTLFIIYLVL